MFVCFGRLVSRKTQRIHLQTCARENDMWIQNAESGPQTSDHDTRKTQPNPARGWREPTTRAKSNPKAAPNKCPEPTQKPGRPRHLPKDRRGPHWSHKNDQKNRPGTAGGIQGSLRGTRRRRATPGQMPEVDPTSQGEPLSHSSEKHMPTGSQHVLPTQARSTKSAPQGSHKTWRPDPPRPLPDSVLTR